MVGEVIADRYELQELVGSGGMSTVYRAYDRDLQRTVAVKVLHSRYADDDEYTERFRREARMAAQLSHPGVVLVIERGDHGDRPYIVFEYVEGENLKQLVDREGPLPVERALELAIQVARGLSVAHGKGLVHRDVKPQNILLNGSGQAKVTDFGIARSLEMQGGVTQTGAVLGTSDYLSPEQAQGGRVSESSDVYSLGVVLYEMLTGELPFAGDNFVAVAMQHINQPAPWVTERRPDVPVRLESAVARALAKDPRERFATMAEFCGELEDCLVEVRTGETGAPTAVIGAPARPASPARRRRGRAAIPLVLVAVGLALAAVVLALVLTNESTSPNGNAGAGTTTSIELTGVGAWDPFGTDGEHDEDASLATDGDSATSWQTENYRSSFEDLGKEGVGLVLDAGRTVSLGELTVTTETPGFIAEIQAGGSPQGPFETVSASQTVEATTTFEVSGEDARYFVVWITEVPSEGTARVNEVEARS